MYNEHYKYRRIQPVEYIRANGLDFFEGNVVKYITRHKEKEGAKDVFKCMDYSRMILNDVYGLTYELILIEDAIRPNNE